MMPDEIDAFAKQIVKEVLAAIKTLEGPPTSSRPREYGMRALPHQEVVTQPDGSQRFIRVVTENELIPPGEKRFFEFGTDRLAPWSVEWLPAPSEFCIEGLFVLHSLLVDDDAAPHFDVRGVFTKAEAMWLPGCPVPASRFAASLPAPIRFNRPAIDNVTVEVKNTSDKPRQFKAKIVGAEPVRPKLDTAPLTDAVTTLVKATTTVPKMRRREYLVEQEIQPGRFAADFAEVLFGERHPLPNTGIKGLPESVEHSFGVTLPFFFERLIVDGECAPHFKLIGLFAGDKNQFPTTRVGENGVDCTLFTEDAPPIRFGCTVPSPCPVIMHVQNTSNKPQKFRAKVVGQEVVPSDATTPTKVVQG